MIGKTLSRERTQVRADIQTILNFDSFRRFVSPVLKSVRASHAIDFSTSQRDGKYHLMCWNYAGLCHPAGVNLILIILVLLLLLGGGGFYIGGPAVGGGGLGLILLIVIIVYLAGGFRGRK